MIELNDQTFDTELARSATPVLVDFYADWCGPCKMLAPVLEHFASYFAERLRIVKVNVETAPALAARFHVSAVPTLKLFRDGRPVDTVVGFIPPQALAEWIEEAANGPARRLTAAYA